MNATRQNAMFQRSDAMSLDALYAEMISRPRDDAPRLRLADAFEAQGQVERAEFIRAQIAWARTDYSVEPEKSHGYFKRWRELIKGREDEWGAGLPSVVETNPSRGFPTWCKVLNSNGFMDHHEEIFARCPIESMTLTWPLHYQDFFRFHDGAGSPSSGVAYRTG
jgi:uncharacterized protein (TIGR02996 family)